MTEHEDLHRLYNAFIVSIMPILARTEHHGAFILGCPLAANEEGQAMHAQDILLAVRTREELLAVTISLLQNAMDMAGDQRDQELNRVFGECIARLTEAAPYISSRTQTKRMGIIE